MSLFHGARFPPGLAPVLAFPGRLAETASGRCCVASCLAAAATKGDLRDARSNLVALADALASALKQTAAATKDYANRRAKPYPWAEA